MSSAAFHPQRLAPRFSGAFAAASRVPGGLEAMSTAIGWVAFDGIRARSERPSPTELPGLAFVVCGFPRTGTTYAQASLERGLTPDGQGWHTHDVLAVDFYLDAGLPVVVTLRDPIDTVASWSTYHGDVPSPTRITQRLRTYEAWHRRLVRWLPHAGIVGISFETLTNPPSPEAGARVRDQDDASGLGPLQQHMPNEARTVILDAHRDMATHHEARRALARAQDVYGEASAQLGDSAMSPALLNPKGIA